MSTGLPLRTDSEMICAVSDYGPLLFELEIMSGMSLLPLKKNVLVSRLPIIFTCNDHVKLLKIVLNIC